MSGLDEYLECQRPSKEAGCPGVKGLIGPLVAFFAVVLIVAFITTRMVAMKLDGTLVQHDERPAPKAQAESLVCYKRTSVTRVMPAKGSNVAFAAHVSLEVELHVETKEYRHEALSSLANHIGRAMIIWRSACTHCVGGNAALIFINGTPYIDSMLAGYLRDANLDHIEYAPPTPSAEEIDRWSHTPARLAVPGSSPSPVSTVTPSVPPTVWPYSVFESTLSQHQTSGALLRDYEFLARDDRVYVKTCAADPQKLPPLLRDVRAALRCSPSVSRNRDKAAHLAIYVRDGFTSCGRSANIVGCSADDLVVELNSHDYRFASHDSGEVVFGLAGPKVDLLHVILHELGHWMGLPHLSAQGNIMADSLEESKCLDDVDVAELDSRVDDEKSRAAGKGAFFYHKPIRH